MPGGPDARRTQILDGLIRLAGRQGLHTASMRTVAAEAGVSLRLVQYYFETKEKLLVAGLEHLATLMTGRLTARLASADDREDPRTVIEAVLTEALPTDYESRVFHLVYTAYAVLAATDPVLAAQPFLRAPDEMERFLTGLLQTARSAGRLPASLDPAAEAALLLAVSAGLGTSVLLGQRASEEAMRLLHYHLDKLFSG
ncbi:TetR family transcriptional regulator C-terminal domain-containing protein [Actinocorallia sp. B10E7]|uniref:TetR/AcrR family transcriptional regulator n=1 Tax=Actinocorallia sp. B10E7 TaxID=3153558 RepID=UPI00325CE944